jgi:ABC-2 type transport system permease protein
MNASQTKTPRAAFNKLLLNEARLAWRTPTGLGGGLGLPLLLLVVFAMLPGTRQPSPDLGGYSYFTLSYPILLTLMVLVLSINTLPQSMILYRQTGILRRLSVTPIPPAWLLAAQIVISLVVIVVGFIILAVAGAAAFSLELPQNLPEFLLALILTVSSLFAVGLCMAAFIRNVSVAGGIGGILFFALMLFGGVWLPRPIMPAVLLDISNWTPLGAGVGALQNAMLGSFPSLQSLLVLAAYTTVFGYLAVRYFKWE